MNQFRVLTLGALSVLTLASCGTAGNFASTGMPQGPTAFGTIAAQGVTHKLGWDRARYEQLFAPHAHPVRIPRAGQLPTTADNRQFCAPIADQGQLGSCTAFSMVKGLREYLQRKEGQAQTPLSPLFFYYQERAADGTIGSDSGSTLTEGMSVLQHIGTSPESDDPYNIAQFKVKPSAQAYSDAGAWKVKTTTQLASLDDVKTALASGHAVSFGFTVYASFRNIKADGLMPTPKRGESVLGGHAVCAVGYDDAKQVLIVRNSWGTSWGDQGYFYMPYAVASGGDADEFFTAE
jgi:C1A family cysteine protease